MTPAHAVPALPMREGSHSEQLQHLAAEIKRMHEQMGPPDPDSWARRLKWVPVLVLSTTGLVWVLTQTGFSPNSPLARFGADSVRIDRLEGKFAEIRAELSTVRGTVDDVKEDLYFANTIACRAVIDQALIRQCSALGLRKQ
jgi:hypothetical protein